MTLHTRAIRKRIILMTIINFNANVMLLFINHNFVFPFVIRKLKRHERNHRLVSKLFTTWTKHLPQNRKSKTDNFFKRGFWEIFEIGGFGFLPNSSVGRKPKSQKWKTDGKSMFWKFWRSCFRFFGHFSYMCAVKSVPVPSEYKLQIKKQELFDFRFCRVQNREKKTKFGVNFVFFFLFCTWQKQKSKSSCFVICNLYSTRKGVTSEGKRRGKFKG